VSDSRSRASDRGSALVLVLVLVTVGGLIAVGLLEYARAVIATRPALHDRNASAEAVKSATRMAISMQRDVGPRECFASSTSWTLDGFAVDTTCSTLSSYTTGRGRLGLVLTAHGGTIQSASFPTWSTGSVGDAFVNTGAQTVASGQTRVSGQWSTTTATWDQRVGDNTDGVAWTYPKLPQVPSFERPGAQATIGTCQVYFPGRYLGTTALTLNGGDHYFASGVYYFERPLVITGGARVVFGEGRFGGCSVDAQAAYASTAPRSHEITGKGATLLLGAGATLTVQESSVRINRRVSTAATRGSEGVALRTVNFGRSDTGVTVPADMVLLSDGTSVPVASHSVTPSANAPAAVYRTSTLGPTGWAVDVRLNGASSTNNRFLVDGYVFVPNSGVRVTSTTSTWALSMPSGVVASSLTLSLPSAPTVATDFRVGLESETIQRRVAIVSTASADGRSATSTAIVEVNSDRSYAINYWVLDP